MNNITGYLSTVQQAESEGEVIQPARIQPARRMWLIRRAPGSRRALRKVRQMKTVQRPVRQRMKTTSPGTRTEALRKTARKPMILL